MEFLIMVIVGAIFGLIACLITLIFQPLGVAATIGLMVWLAFSFSTVIFTGDFNWFD